MEILTLHSVQHFHLLSFWPGKRRPSSLSPNHSWTTRPTRASWPTRVAGFLGERWEWIVLACPWTPGATGFEGKRVLSKQLPNVLVRRMWDKYAGSVCTCKSALQVECNPLNMGSFRFECLSILNVFFFITKCVICCGKHKNDIHFVEKPIIVYFVFLFQKLLNYEL